MKIERTYVSRAVSRTPTFKQASKLSVLANGAIVLAPGRRDWGPLLRRGWVEPISEDEGKRYLPPLRITAEGLRALAAAFEAYPDDMTPEIKPKDRPLQLDEPPTITRLKADLEAAREERSRARQAEHQIKVKLRKALRVLEGVDQPW